MLIHKFAVAATAAMLVVAPMAAAETLRQNDGPAEFPPADYQGRQYVDSEGCVYLRAGYAGQVTWVPRVTRDRKVLCGFKPTFARAEPAPAVDPTPAPRRAEAPGAPLPTVAGTVEPAKPASKPARAAAPKPKRTVAKAPPPSPRPYRAAQGAPSTVCPNASEFSRQYINDVTRYTVRCGPQAAAEPGIAAPAATPAPQRQVAAAAARRPVRQARASVAQPAPRVAVQRPAPVAMPKGYKPLWTDGRLNPNRGLGTAEGKAAMDLVWTETVPRRLIEARTGKDVTRDYARLEYPYTTYAEQRAHLATKGAAASAKPARTRVSTKGRAPASAAPASHRYVQVGAFGDPANAQATVARLQRMGLPVSARTVTSNGKALKVVYAGPFQRQDRLAEAHARLRRSGYPGAILRK